jgi:hypothetical protein
MILADLADYLTNKQDIHAIVEGKVYANRAPRHASAPYILLGRVSEQTPYSLAGEIGITQAIVQVACWASDPGGPYAASELAELVRDKISGYRGDWGSTFVSDCSLVSGPVEIQEAPDDASDNWFHAVSMDFMVTHAREVPSLT